MKKIIIFLFFLSFASSSALAEIVELQKSEKSFGTWKVYCETDIMMDVSYCKIATKFFDNGSVIRIEPTAKFFNQLFIVIPQIKIGSFVKIRIDKNDLILSNNIRANDFGLIEISDDKKNNLYNQMKKGDFLFFRFNVRSSEKDITVKINLKDFRNALDYYESRVFSQK